MSPGGEHLKDGEEFLVMRVVVQFRRVESPGVERDWTDRAIRENVGEHGGNSVVRGVSLDYMLEVWVEMMEERV